jgi:hypothetical protein
MNRPLAFRVLSMLGLLALGCSDSGEDGGGGPSSDEVTLAEPTGTYEGKTYGEWAGAWWNWLYSNPASTNPALDETGEFANEKQTENVFFLAGTFGTTESRSFSLPADEPVFFPIITSQADNCGVPEPDQLTSEELQAAAEDMTDAVAELSLEIDGESFATSPEDFADYRLAVTPMSYVVPAEDSLYDAQGSDFEGNCEESYTTGYFVMLNGFPAGDHTLHFRARTPGATPAEDFVIEVTDEITAE